MPKTAPKPKANPACTVCRGKGWFYAGHMGSPWPAKCFRCFPDRADVRTPPKEAK